MNTAQRLAAAHKRLNTKRIQPAPRRQLVHITPDRVIATTKALLSSGRQSAEAIIRLDSDRRHLQQDQQEPAPAGRPRGGRSAT